VHGHVVLFVEDEIRQLELMRRSLEKLVIDLVAMGWRRAVSLSAAQG
jgi:hypothetical protein